MAREGRTFVDRQMTSAVRNKVLADIFEVLKETKKVEAFGEYKKQMLLKLASTVLPRINEHMGEGGGAIKISQVLDDIERK